LDNAEPPVPVVSDDLADIPLLDCDSSKTLFYGEITYSEECNFVRPQDGEKVKRWQCVGLRDYIEGECQVPTTAVPSQDTDSPLGCSDTQYVYQGKCTECAISSSPSQDRTICYCNDGFTTYDFGNTVQCISTSFAPHLMPPYKETCGSDRACSTSFIDFAEISCPWDNQISLCCKVGDIIDEDKCVDHETTVLSSLPENPLGTTSTLECTYGKIGSNGNCKYCTVMGDIGNTGEKDNKKYICSWFFGFYWDLQCPDGMKDNGKDECVCKDSSKILTNYDIYAEQLCLQSCENEGYIAGMYLCDGNAYLPCGSNIDLEEVNVGGKKYECNVDLEGNWIWTNTN